MYSIWDKIKNNIVMIISSRSVVLIIVFCLLFSILVGRLFNLQIIEGEEYLNNYKLQIQKTRTIQANRGKICDRNGNVLAYNALAYSITFEDNSEYIGEEKNREINKEIQKIIEIVESHGDSVVSNFNIVLDNNDQYQYAMENETLKLRFLADVFGLTTIDKLSDEQRNMTAKELIDYLCTDKLNGYGIDQEKLSPKEVLKLINIRYAISLNRFQKYIPAVVAEDVSDATAAEILEKKDQLPGVDVAETSLRRYNDSKYFSNIIGYTGQISKDEYDALDKKDQEKYTLQDTIGKSGLEKELDTYLQGEQGEVKLYVNSVGKVIETVSVKNPTAGNDLYLTIDADLQKAAYNILEQELAGILLAKMVNVLDYDRSTSTDAGDVVVASGDAYYAFIGNDILDMQHFSAKNAGDNEKAVYKSFSNYKDSVLKEIEKIMLNDKADPYNSIPREYQAYLSFIVNDLLTNSRNILLKDAIDTKDEIYVQWRYDETINIHNYLNYAISKNWIDSSKIKSEDSDASKYSSAGELYESLVAYVLNALENSTNFDKLIYQYMIKNGAISGTQLCMILYEQEILSTEDPDYGQLASGAISSYDFLRAKIQTLEITPGQLGLEPCTGSMVITDPNNGDVLACVSYPGYDNNRLANSMDSEYYNKLITNSARPFYNNATQEKTAPGSTYKPLSAIAGLTEGVIDENTIVYCDGTFKKVTPNINCWVYPDQHDYMDVVGAIANSCNVFFNEVGLRLSMENVADTENTDENGQVKTKYSSKLGLSKLRKYATMFGLDETSGIEVPESEPQISDDSSVPSAMGQGTNNYTTSQLARYISAVATEGDLYDLTLLDRIEDVDGKEIKSFENEKKDTIDEISQNTWNCVHSGMHGVIESYAMFSKVISSDVALYGKTGTAQQSTTHADHGLFVGFTKRNNNTELAFAIRIANGYSSTFAAEVGKDVIEYYYGLTPANEIIDGKANAVTVTSHGD